MPTYEYRCRDCGEEIQVKQAFTDDPLTECTSCSGSLRKVFGSVGISFKGSGFYKTDSRSPVGAGRSKGNGTGEGGSDTSSGDKASDSSNAGDAKSPSKSDKADKKASANGSGSAASTGGKASSPSSTSS